MVRRMEEETLVDSYRRSKLIPAAPVKPTKHRAKRKPWVRRHQWVLLGALAMAPVTLPLAVAGFAVFAVCLLADRFDMGA